MLEFYLENDEKQELIEGLQLEEVMWLSKYEIIEKRFSDDINPMSLPYYDDFTLTISQVNKLYQRVKNKELYFNQIPGFTSTALKKLKGILEKGINNNCGLNAICD